MGKKYPTCECFVDFESCIDTQETKVKYFQIHLLYNKPLL